MTVKVLTTSYPIFSNLSMVIGWFGGGVVKSINKTIGWDMTRTTVTGARLVFTVSCDSVLMNDITITLNGEQVFFRTLGAETISDRVDISSLLQNGVNVIAATGFARLHGATLVVTIVIEVDFQGIEPSVTPTPTTVLGIPLKYILLGGGAVLMSGIVLMRRKKR